MDVSKSRGCIHAVTNNLATIVIYKRKSFTLLDPACLNLKIHRILAKAFTIKLFTAKDNNTVEVASGFVAVSDSILVQYLRGEWRQECDSIWRNTIDSNL